MKQAWSERSTERSRGWRSVGQTLANSLNHLLSRWQHPQHRESASVDHCLSVNKDFELAIVAANHLNISVQFAAQARRHTDGVQTGNSIHTVTNCYSGHVPVLLREPRQP